MNSGKTARVVHIISHGPHCLDGVAAAVAVARASGRATVVPRFVNNPKIDEAVLTLRCEPPEACHEVWITDVSWTTSAADRHLQELARRGVEIYWIDHHRTAIERFQAGEVNVPFAGRVISEEYAASRLAYDYVRARLKAQGEVSQALEDFWPVIRMADDNDRWLHQVAGSRELALTVRALGNFDAYEDLLRIDGNVTYTRRMRQALERVEGELRRTFEIAERTRVARSFSSGVTLVAAVCDGYPSEIADAWGKSMRNAVFALFDAKSLGVSLRRSPDCRVDLSHLARAFGGGGHAAAAGCELPQLQKNVAVELAEAVGAVLSEEADVVE